MRRKAWLALVAACAVAVAAAGPGPAAGQPGIAPPRQEPVYTPPGELPPDTVRTNGARTLYPFIFAAGEDFRELYPNVDIQSGFDGDAAALARACAGTGEQRLDIAALASYPAEGQLARCTAPLLELELGYVVVAVVANPGNEDVECLTIEELARIWSPEAEGVIVNWEQVREGLPARPLTAYSLEADRPLFDFFTERVMGEAGAIRLDYVPLPPSELVGRVAEDPGALAFVGLGAYRNNRDKLHLLAVDGGGGCVLPEEAPRRVGAAALPRLQTVQVEGYALAHPLVLMVRADSLGREAALAFTWSLLRRLERASEVLEALGYTPPHPEVQRRNYVQLLDAAGRGVGRTGVGE